MRVGYFAQHQTDELDLNATPVIELSRRRPNDNDERLRSQLGRFGFSQQRADTKVANLSGGEKARLLFALMTCDAPHILLLDEPTNHLDVDSRQALIQAINGFAGAVVIVSHDPHVLELTADRFWLVDDGRIATFDGDMEAYRALLFDGPATNSKKETESARPTVDKREQRRLAAEQRQARVPLQKQLARIEKNMAKLQEEKMELENRMADPALYDGEADAVVALQKELGWISPQLAEVEAAWLAAQGDLAAARR